MAESDSDGEFERFLQEDEDSLSPEPAARRLKPSGAYSASSASAVTAAAAALLASSKLTKNHKSKSKNKSKSSDKKKSGKRSSKTQLSDSEDPPSYYDQYSTGRGAGLEDSDADPYAFDMSSSAFTSSAQVGEGYDEGYAPKKTKKKEDFKSLAKKAVAKSAPISMEDRIAEILKRTGSTQFQADDKSEDEELSDKEAAISDAKEVADTTSKTEEKGDYSQQRDHNDKNSGSDSERSSLSDSLGVGSADFEVNLPPKPSSNRNRLSLQSSLDSETFAVNRDALNSELATPSRYEHQQMTFLKSEQDEDSTTEKDEYGDEDFELDDSAIENDDFPPPYSPPQGLPKQDSVDQPEEQFVSQFDKMKALLLADPLPAVVNELADTRDNGMTSLDQERHDIQLQFTSNSGNAEISQPLDASDTFGYGDDDFEMTEGSRQDEKPATTQAGNTETMQDGVGESSADYADEGFEADTGVQNDAQDSSPSPEPLVAENTQLITQSFGDHTVDRNAKVEALLTPKYGDFYSLEDDGKADEDIVRDETQKPKLSQEPMPPLVDVAKEVSTTAPASVFEIHASQHESPPSSPPPPPPPDDDEEDDHELHRFVLDAPVKGTDFETETPTAQHPATAVRVSPLSAGDRFRKIENQVATLRFVNPLGTPNMVAVNSPASEAVHPVSAKSLTNRQDDAAPPYMEPMSISFDAGLLAEDEETQREIDDFLRSSQVLRQEHRAAARRASLARENELVLRLQQAQRHIIQLKEHIQATASDPRQLGGGAVPKPSDAQSNHDEEHTKSTGANDSTSNIPHSAFKKLEKEIKTQDNLIAAFQKENERLMQQLKQVRQDVQYDVHEANEELRQQIRKLQDQIGEAASLGSGGGDLTSKAQYRVAVEARLEAEAHALALQEELAAVRLSYQQKLNEVTLELDRVKKTKVELECRYEGVDLAQVAQETQHARDLQSELDLCKKEHAHALSALQKKLDWYVENQRLLDDQDEELRKLRRLVAEKPSDAATVMPSKGQMKHSQLGGPSPARPHRRSPNDIRRIQELEGRLSEMEEAMRRRHPDSLSNLILASRRAEDESKTRALEHDYQEKLAALSRELEQAHEASETKLASFRQQQEKLLLQYRRKIKEQEKLLKQFSKAPLSHRTMTKDATGTNATPDAELAKVRRFYTDKIKELERKWETKYRSLRKQQYSGLGSSQQTQEGLTYADSAVVIANLQRQIREQELELKQKKAKVEQLEAESQLTEARPEDSPTAIDVKSNLKQQIKLKELEEQVADLTAQLQDSESARAQLAQTLTTVQTLGLARSLNANVPQTTTLTESVPTIETTPPQQNDAELAQLRQEMYDTREALRTERANSLEKIATLEKQITAHAEQNALLKSQLTNSQREMQSLQTLALKAERHNRALEAQARRVPELEEEVLSLQRELELPRTPSMVQYRSLELKVATLEQKHKLREAELKVVLDRALTSTHLEQLSRERAHRAAMAAKNAEIATFKSQLEEILNELAQLQRAPSSRRPADGGDDATR